MILPSLQVRDKQQNVSSRVLAPAPRQPWDRGHVTFQIAHGKHGLSRTALSHQTGLYFLYFSSPFFL